MSKVSTEMVIGMDISDKNSEICTLSAEGEKLSASSIENNLEEIHTYFNKFDHPERVLIAMEAGSHSPWMSMALSEMGFQVLVGNPRKLRLIWQSERKSDRRDAEMIARIARFDKTLFNPIYHRSRASQATLAVLKSRDTLVRCRTQLINSIKGMLKSMGIKISSSSSSAFYNTIMKELPKEYHFALKDSIEIVNELSKKIAVYDKKISDLCEKTYPETNNLRSIAGVGPITSLAYVLVIEHPERFRRSRDVGPFIGLVPKRDQSGAVDKQLGISKTGNEFLRRLLVSAAQYVLGPFGPDCELRRFGQRIADRGGSGAKKKAVIAVARKLAVIMYRLWRDQTDYNPFFKAEQNNKKIKKAA